MQLVESKNLGFFNGSLETKMIYPLNIKEADFAEEELLEEKDVANVGDIYHLCLDSLDWKPLKSVFAISRAIARLLLAYNDEKLENIGGFGFDNSNNFYADYYDGSKEEFEELFNSTKKDFTRSRRQVFKIDASGAISAFVVDEKGGRSALTLKTSSYNNSHTSSGVIFALLAYLISSVEEGMIDFTCATYEPANIIHKHFLACVDAMKKGDSLALATSERFLNADMYTLLKYESRVKAKYGVSPLKNRLYDKNNFDLLTQNEFELKTVYGNSSLLQGEKKIGKVSGIQSVKKKKTVKDLIGKYSLDPARVLTADETNMINSNFISDDYVVRDEVQRILRMLVDSTSSPRPMRNVMLTGDSGTGKSTSVRMMAKLLNLPYMFINFQPSTEVSDLYLTPIANTDNGVVNKEEFEKLSKELIDCTSISYDPSGEYERITGIHKEDATEGDCVVAICEKLFALRNKESNSQFKYVESPLVQAFRYGYVVELQEVNLVRKNGVLAGLNSALDDLGQILLPTGEIVRRHPDCVVVFTANIGYAGRTQFDQSVVSRMNIMYDFEDPSDKELADSIKQNSGLDDDGLIKKMIMVYKGMRAKLEETGANDGSCDPRALFDWATSCLSINPYDAAISTIINKATFDKEVKAELIICLESQFKAEEEFDF